jgi:hypothetical protein
MKNGSAKSTLMTQAEFARANGVSRKTVTQWKREGRIVLQGNMIDVKASHLRLGRRSRLNQSPMRASKQAAEGRPPAAEGEIELLSDPAIEASAVDSAVWNLAKALLPRFEPREARRLCDQVLGEMRRELAQSLKDEEIDPPDGFRRWEDWPELKGPVFTDGDWSDLVDEFAKVGRS